MFIFHILALYHISRPKGRGIRPDDANKKYKKKAFKLAHDIRKFEIELFWKRGTYYWAFILGAYTAYFYLLSIFIKIESVDTKIILQMKQIQPFGKFILFILAFIGFFFCLSWVLINKGSKFWQKNWEEHIDILEDEISGKLYKVILNTNTNEFEHCPLSKKAYDYSVTKITTWGSIVLTCVAFLLLAFHTALLFPCLQPFFDELYKKNICVGGVLFFIFKIVLVIILFCFVIHLVTECNGNKQENKNTTEKWVHRKMQHMA